MHKPEIHDRGRGPEIKGTRITVYDVMDYYTQGWDAHRIVTALPIGTDEAQCAIDYIRSHREEVEANYRRIVARAEEGNPPEIEARLAANRPKFLAWKEKVIREAAHRRSLAEAKREGHPAGR